MKFMAVVREVQEDILSFEGAIETVSVKVDNGNRHGVWYSVATADQPRVGDVVTVTIEPVAKVT